MVEVSIRRLLEPQWLEEGPVWDNLLGRSVSDPLFLSHRWQSLCWRHFFKGTGELVILAGYVGEDLVGVVSLVHRLVRRGPLKLRSIHVLGSALGRGDFDGAMSEYLDLIALPGFEQSFREAVVGYLCENFQLDEFGVSLTKTNELWEVAWRKAGTKHTYFRGGRAQVSYQARIGRGFDTYLAMLSGDARRKMFNQRRMLAAHGPIEFTRVAGEDIGRALDDLNRLHARRWGLPAYSDRVMAFYSELARDSGAMVHSIVTTLTAGGRLVSVLHDLRAGEVQYNLQMGFDEFFDKRLSLGILHLGFSMERASAEGVEVYDLLVGRGKHSDYKIHFTSERQNVSTVWMLRGAFLSNVARLYDQFRRSA